VTTPRSRSAACAPCPRVSVQACVVRRRVGTALRSRVCRGGLRRRLCLPCAWSQSIEIRPSRGIDSRRVERAATGSV